MRAVLVVILLFALPAVSAAGDPGARDPLTMDDTVTGVKLASENGLIGVGTEDPGSRFTVPPNPDADVWFIYSRDGKALMQEGKLDPTDCDTAVIVDDCQTHVTAIAFDSTGQRMAIVSHVDQTQGSIILLADRLSGPVRQFSMSGAVMDVAMNEAGTSVAAVTTLQTPDDNLGRVYYYNWASATPSAQWNAETLEGATDVAVSPDGTRIAVAAGGDHYRFSSGSNAATRDATFPGVALDVAISLSTRHVDVGVSSEGWFQVYDDTTPAGQRELRARDEESPLQAAALSLDGRLMAVGNAAGNVYVYGLDTDLNILAGLRGKIDLTAGITDLAFARDGKTLVIAEGTKLHQYAVTADEVIALWSTDLGAGALGKVAVDGTGSLVASAVGAGVRLFDAIHSIGVQAPAGSQARPGETKVFDVVYTNTGNRMAPVEFDVSAPAGWSVDIDQDEVDLAPGETITVSAIVTVPAFEPPGAKTVTFKHDLGTDAAGDVSTDVQITVPTVTAWTIEAVGAASKNIASGGQADFIVKVTNGGNVAGTPNLGLSVNKAAWSAAVADTPGSMAPGQASEISLELTAPTSAASGDSATATVTFAGAAGSPLKLSATVDARFGVEVTATPATLVLPLEEQGTVTVVVRNTGNAPDSYRVDLEVPDDWTVTFEEGGLTSTVADLAPGTTKTLQVTVTAPDDEDADDGMMEVRAVSLADPTKVATDQVDMSIEEPEEEEGGGGGGNGIPFPPAIFVLALVLVAAFIKRRA